MMPIATDEPGIYEMAVDSTHLYWVEDGQFDHEANIRRMPLGGGPIETVFSTPERMYALAVADGYVYAAHTGVGYTGEIYKIAVTGGPATTLATPFNPTSISVDAGWVYYTEAESPGGSVQRVATTGGAPEMLASDVDGAYDLAASDGILFYSEMNRGRMMRVTPGNTPVELSGGWLATDFMTVDAANVYFTACNVDDCGVLRLVRVPRAGGAVEEMMVSSPSEQKLAVAGGQLQWGASVLPTTGGPSTLLDTDDIVPTAVAVTADAYYFADFFTGNIYRSPR